MINYLYYKKDYGGKVITNKEEFERYKNQAELYIKLAINSQEKYSEEDIGHGICAIAEKIYEKGDLGNIKSESVDGYSVTYSGDFRKELYETLKLYLPPRLLYRGI